jgi:hypothetical protein
MLNMKYIRAVAVVFGLTALTLSSGASPRPISERRGLTVVAPDNLLLESLTGSDRELAFKNDPEPFSAPPDPLDSTSTFYTVRRDLRRCASPMCGGFFVKRVNLPMTRCANGRSMPECYVAGIVWNGQPEVEISKALLRGNVMARSEGRFGNLGAFQVIESWQAVNSGQVAGTFYRVRDRGLRCIAFPCPTHHEAKLNSIASGEIAGVDLSGVDGAGDVPAAMTRPEGAIIVGDHVTVKGPGGSKLQLKATQAYLRVAKSVSTMKPCFKTGCSAQVCADQSMITTCEWRPEYACYKKAACERQQDGNCGFTRSRVLEACLAGK